MFGFAGITDAAQFAVRDHLCCPGFPLSYECPDARRSGDVSGVGQPAAQGEAGIEQGRIRKAGLAKDRLILRGREDVQVIGDGAPRAAACSGSTPEAGRNAEYRDSQSGRSLPVRFPGCCRFFPHF